MFPDAPPSAIIDALLTTKSTIDATLILLDYHTPKSSPSFSLSKEPTLTSSSPSLDVHAQTKFSSSSSLASSVPLPPPASTVRKGIYKLCLFMFINKSITVISVDDDEEHNDPLEDFNCKDASTKIKKARKYPWREWETIEPTEVTQFPRDILH